MKHTTKEKIHNLIDTHKKTVIATVAVITIISESVGFIADASLFVADLIGGDADHTTEKELGKAQSSIKKDRSLIFDPKKEIPQRMLRPNKEGETNLFENRLRKMIDRRFEKLDIDEDFEEEILYELDLMK